MNYLYGYRDPAVVALARKMHINLGDDPIRSIAEAYRARGGIPQPTRRMLAQTLEVLKGALERAAHPPARPTTPQLRAPARLLTPIDRRT